jgi:indolepyruvate ferredoxin oxidoreductase beta subunit
METQLTPKAITVAILAMGGEGGGVLADWLVDLAENSGYFAQSTSVPGVAQRTGATIYYIELFPEAPARSIHKDPVLALMPIPGEVDIVVASELMEAARAVERGLVTPDRTTLIASTHRVYSMTERTAMGDGRVDSATLLKACSSAAKVFVRQDFARLADEKRSVISAALFGALAGTGRLPFERKQFEDAIRKGGVGVESSLAAFDAGFSTAPPNAVLIAQAVSTPRLQTLIARVEKSFPPVSHSILKLGTERLVDYQDEAYATEYLDRLEVIRDRDTSFGDGRFELLKETARYLALWMAYEDAIRVADLKIRRERFERVRLESRATPGQIVEISEFLHPRVGEIADILPAALGRWLLNTRWACGLVERFTIKGKTLRTTSVTGFLQLYVLAGLRRWRRGSFRFREEQARIREWLDRIPALAAENYALALEVAECPRLIKGYGDTHALGLRNFDIVLGALSKLDGRADAAVSIRKLREAALGDDSGKRLSEALREVNA